MHKHKHKKVVGKRFRNVVLTERGAAYYYSNGSLIVKGSFKNGKLLKVDTHTVVNKGGLKFYLVKNVSHENIYVHLTKLNCKPLRASHLLQKGSMGSPTEMKKAMNVVMAKTETPKSQADGLCYYEDTAFDYDDGFGFVSDSGEEKTELEKKATALKDDFREHEIHNHKHHKHHRHHHKHHHKHKLDGSENAF